MLQQSPFATQRSSQLLGIGAVNGSVLVTHEWWRLVASQFLHVHWPHMLFNVGCILMLGAQIEYQRGTGTLLILCLVGGTSGQLASVFAYPSLVSSGASQALMALCAAALFVKSNTIRAMAGFIVVVQIALDLYASGTIKTGHAVGFIAGLILTLSILALALRRKRVAP